MTQKAGQKCTAIRRVLVPAERADRLRDDLVDRLSGDRRRQPAPTKACAWGRWPRRAQRADVREGVDELARDGRLVFGSANVKPVGAPEGKGFFTSPVLIEVEPGAAAPSRPRARGLRPRGHRRPLLRRVRRRGRDRGPRARRARVLRLFRGHRLHGRPRPGRRALPRPRRSWAARRSPRPRRDRARSCRCSCTAGRGARAAARSWAALRGLGPLHAARGPRGQPPGDRTDCRESSISRGCCAAPL